MMDREIPILVAGAGGFIGGHLVAHLQQHGYRDIVGADIKPFDEWWQPAPRMLHADLSRLQDCRRAVSGREWVFNLAADMGGMGFIEQNKSLCMLNVLINTHMLLASRDAAVRRYFFASSACVYPQELQRDTVLKLKESYAYPADCEAGYGWEKLFGEQMLEHFAHDYGIEPRVGRFHMIFGPRGTWQGGREKVPAALCRKVAQAERDGSREIEIWGDGGQVRSGLFVTDAVEAVTRIMEADYPGPLNIGSQETFSINELLALVEDVAGTRPLERVHDLSRPQGVRARCSDNALIAEVIGWAPKVALREGLERTYAWVREQVTTSPCSSIVGTASPT